MKEIPLTRGLVALVDDADFERLSRWKWYAYQKRGRTAYAVRQTPLGTPWTTRRTRQRMVWMHVEIFGGSCDHANRNGLDNRRNNLRNATRAQQSQNHGRHANNSSWYKGVSWHKASGKWVAQIGFNGRRRHLGLFSSKEEAARAYDAAARQSFGEFAVTNFKQEEIPCQSAVSFTG